MSLARSVGGFFFDIGGRRRLGGAVGHMIRAYAAAVALWSFYAAAFSRIDSLALTVIFLCLMLAPAFLMIRASNAAPADRAPLYDWALFAASLACAAYFIASIETIATRISLFFPLTEVQVGFATLVVVLALEITRRTVGLFLMLLVLVFIAYNLWGDLIDGALGHGYISFNHFLDINIYTTDGLFGVPVRVAATYAFLFVMFGTFLEKAGGGAFFFNISAALAGRTPGGPAKVAVVSSALFGTMSGSPTADVVTTGSITIPMMRRLGYRASLAGGVEVAASTGGSILPPVMGSAAFIMAELTGIDYAVIVFAAIIPAALYYLGIVVQVHLRSVGLGLRAMSAEETPGALATLREGWIYFIPLGVLVAALAQGYSPTMVAAIATLSVIATSWLKPSARLGPRAIYEALSETVVRMLGVTGACAAAGLVIGGITMTGLAAKFSTIAFAFAGDWMFLALLLVGGGDHPARPRDADAERLCAGRGADRADAGQRVRHPPPERAYVPDVFRGDVGDDAAGRGRGLCRCGHRDGQSARHRGDGGAAGSGGLRHAFRLRLRACAAGAAIRPAQPRPCRLGARRDADVGRGGGGAALGADGRRGAAGDGGGGAVAVLGVLPGRGARTGSGGGGAGGASDWRGAAA
jgi:TRAP transporter 4TM/12TM fusion protein